MRFVVSQISPTIELVFADTEEFINVYPTYHQKSGLIYANVNSTDWVVSGTQYRWETTYPDITVDTVPVIQLVYSYNATASEKQEQYAAFRLVKVVETLEGKLRLYVDTKPTVNFRIRYRLLDKMDLAIPLNRMFGVGLGYQASYNEMTSYLTSINPITGQSLLLSSLVPMASTGTSGIVSADIIARLLKLEDSYNVTMNQPYRIIGYDSASAASPITTYYADITAMQGISADTWYKECEIWTTTDASDFTTAFHMFYQQQATVLNLTHVYTGNVETFSYALAANVLLQSIVGLQLLNTSKAYDISYMFADDVALEEVDLSSCDLSRVTNIEGLFKNCSSLQKINVSSIDFTALGQGDVALIEQPDIFTGVPDNCVIWVAGETQRTAILDNYPNLTGITYN